MLDLVNINTITLLYGESLILISFLAAQKFMEEYSELTSLLYDNVRLFNCLIVYVKSSQVLIFPRTTS